MAVTHDQLATLRKLAAAALPAICDLTEAVCLIPAPSYHEERRAHFVAEQLRARGLTAEIDEIGNVVARRTGRGTAKTLLLAAHTDTVFPLETELRVRREPGRMIGPAIGDNSLAVASLIELATLLDEARIETPGDLLLVANVGEEGLGNLRGIRAVCDQYGDELGGVIALEGHNVGRVTHGAVGSKRIRVTVEGPGGHSWGAFGQPSAIHELGLIIGEIARIRVPDDPKTTFNVGVIEGGVSVNTIAPRATAVIDMRSIDPDALATLSHQVESIITRRRSEQISTSIEVLGERPAGWTAQTATIVQTASAILRRLGIEPILNASSTDANIPISRGIPAICIGLTRGSGAHRVDEMIEVAPIEQGILQLALLVAAFPVA
ncbi:MAG TPA: M20/M25/M40 family metallo-hydrolase [Nitrolancea sp.]|nr:M20/M25/M40 family metallo-hydrolase [Nitrolancea sp.]